MPQPWDAEFRIEIGAATSVIEDQFPELSPVKLEFLGEGWDNVVFCADGKRLFRFPRRRMALSLIETEIRFLPALAVALPLRIPEPKHIGEPSEIFPHRFYGYEKIHGVPAHLFNWLNARNPNRARAVGSFLSGLHSLSIAADVELEAPKDEIGRTNLYRRAVRAVNRLRKNRESLKEFDRDALIDLAVDLAETPQNRRTACWVHGDLYPAHILVDANGNLSGVIDWGDMHLGDSSLDLSIAFTLLEPEERIEFKDSYGEIDPDSWKRARFCALHYGAVLTDYGIDTANEDFIRMGKACLSSVLID